MRTTMSRRAFITGLTALGVAPLAAFSASNELLIYCGITMVRPINEMGQLFEKENNIKVTVSQGGSEDLYRSLKTARKGDLYLPGEPNYRTKYVGEGLMGDFATIGYNQAALFVAEGNPKSVKADVKELLRSDLTVVLCSPEQGSIGQETQRVLKSAHIYDEATAQASALLPDSRTLNLALKKKEADLTLNWRATAFFPDNAAAIDPIDLPTDVAVPQALLLNLLTFSEQPEMAKAFMAFASSEKGQAIMRKHGFLDAQQKS